MIGPCGFKRTNDDQVWVEVKFKFTKTEKRYEFTHIFAKIF